MITATILDQHIQQADGSYAPAVLAIAPNLRDVTASRNVPTSPNMVVIEVTVDSLDVILDHPDYGAGAILYDEPNPYPTDGRPDAAEYGQRRAYCARLGMSNAQFRAVFGTQANPLARGAGASNLIAWCRALRRAA